MRWASLGLVLAAGCGLLDLGGPPPAAAVVVGPVSPPVISPVPPRFGAIHRPAEDLPGAVERLVPAADGQHMLVVGGGRLRLLGTDGSPRAQVEVGAWEAATVGPGGVFAVATGGTVALYDAQGAPGPRLPLRATDVAWSPDGSYLAVATEEDVRLVEVATGALRATYQPEYGADLVVWHPDGRTLYGADAFHAYAWDVTTGQEVGRFGSGLYETLGVSPDGASLWTWNGSDAPTRWDARTHEKLGRLEGSSWLDLVQGGAVHAGGTHLLVDTRMVGVDGTGGWTAAGVDAWTDATLAPDHGGVWVGTEDHLERWTFLPEGAFRAVGPRQAREGGWSRGDLLQGLAWTPDGAGILAVSEGGRVQRWDVASGAEAWSIRVRCGDEETPEAERECSLYALGVHGGRLWAEVEDRVVEVDLASGAVAATHSIEGSVLGRWRDGTWVGLDEGLVLGAAPGTGRRVALDGLEAVAMGGDRLLVRSEGQLQARDGQGRPRGPAWPATLDDGRLAISPDGTRWVESNGDGGVVRDAASGATLARVRGWGPRIDPTGRWLVTGLHAAALTDLQTGAQVELRPPGGGVVGATAFSPDGTRLAVADNDDELGDRIWVLDLAAVSP